MDPVQRALYFVISELVYPHILSFASARGSMEAVLADPFLGNAFRFEGPNSHWSAHGASKTSTQNKRQWNMHRIRCESSRDPRSNTSRLRGNRELLFSLIASHSSEGCDATPMIRANTRHHFSKAPHSHPPNKFCEKNQG